MTKVLKTILKKQFVKTEWLELSIFLTTDRSFILEGSFLEDKKSSQITAYNLYHAVFLLVIHASRY